MVDVAEELSQAALNRIDPAKSSLEEIEKAAGVLKTIKECGIADNNIKQQKYEFWKAIATIATPIVAVFGFFVTVWQITSSLDATRRQAENAQWQDLMKSIGSDEGISSRALAPQLRIFAKSAEYGTKVQDISKVILGDVVNLDDYHEIYKIAFSGQSESIDDVLYINRKLNKTRVSYAAKCEAASLSLTIP